MASIFYNLYIDDLLRLEILLFEVVAQVEENRRLLHRSEFALQVASLEAEQSVGQRVLLLAPDVLSNQFQQVGQGHDGPAHHEIVLGLELLYTAVLEGDVLQPDGFGHTLGYLDFLAHPVDQVETTLGKENGQRNTRESAAGTHVEYRGAVSKVDGLGDTQRVEYVVQIEVVYIFARDYVNLRIPVGIQGAQSLELALLGRGQIGEIGLDILHEILFNQSSNRALGEHVHLDFLERDRYLHLTGSIAGNLVGVEYPADAVVGEVEVLVGRNVFGIENPNSSRESGEARFRLLSNWSSNT